MGEPMNYGAGKGCQFYWDGCAAKNQFSEFCYAQSPKKCNSLMTQLSSCSENEFTNSCSYYSTNECDQSKNELCFDLEDTNKNSVCYTSQIIQTTSTTDLEVTDKLGNKYICKTNGEILQSSPSIRCPSNIQAYIQSITNECPNFCSGNGYCNNGVCICHDNYYGNDCLTKKLAPPETPDAPAKQFSYQLLQSKYSFTDKCPDGYEKSTSDSKPNPTDPTKTIEYTTCKCAFSNKCNKCYRYECSECVEEYQLGKKSICYSCGKIANCLKCILDETVDPIVALQCLKCKPGFFLKEEGVNGNSCEPNCKTGQYYDKVDKKCKDCLRGCAECLDLLQCSSCLTNYSYDLKLDSPKGIRVCYINCDQNSAAVKDYTDEKNFNICQKCSEGTGYENCDTCHFDKAVKKCDTCLNNFKVSDADNKCSECKETYFLTEKQCKKCAQEHCIQCETYERCKKCETNYYVKDGVCVQDCGLKFYASSSGVCEKCIEKCDICLNNQECVVCTESFYYDKIKTIEGCLKSDKNCHKSCKLCTSYYYPTPALIPAASSLEASSDCFACVDVPLLASFEPNQQQDALSLKLIYKGRCQKKFCYENQDSKPQPKYEKLYKLCQYCDETNLCYKCNNNGGCSECLDKDKYYLDPDTQKCVSWSGSCIKKDNTLGCLNCLKTMDLGYKNACVKQCPENYDIVKDGSDSYCKKVECFRTCATCVGPSYNECLTCIETRKLDIYHGASSGTCPCQNEDYTDTLGQQCEKTTAEFGYMVSSYLFATASLVATTVCSALLQNPFSLFFLADHAQSVGQLTYVDKHNPYGLDRSMAAYKYFNLNILIPTPIVNHKLEEKRILQEEAKGISRILAESGINVTKPRGTQNLSKIVDYHSSKNFLCAGFWSYIFLSIVWIFKAVGHCLLSMHVKQATPGGEQVDTPVPQKWMYVMEEIFMGAFPLGVYIITCSELSLLAFLDFRDTSMYIKDSDGFEPVSVIFSVIYLIFSLVYLLYLSLSPKEGVIYTLFDDYRRGSMFFYIFLAFKKSLQSLLIVFLEGNPTSQIFSVLIVESFFIFYLILVRPFKKETFFNIIYIGGEILVFVVIIVFTIFTFTKDNRDRQNECAQVLLCFMIFLMIYHIVCAIFLICYYLFKCCRQETPSRRYHVENTEQKQLQTEAGNNNEVEMISGKNHSVELETRHGKTATPKKAKQKAEVIEETSNEASCEIPQVFQQRPSQENERNQSSNNQKDSVVEGNDAEDLIIVPPQTSQRQEKEKEQKKIQEFIEGSENVSNSSRHDKITKVPVFEQAHVRQMSDYKKEKKDLDNSSRYMKTVSANSVNNLSGVYSAGFQEDGILDEMQKQNIKSRESNNQIYLDSQTPVQSHNYNNNNYFKTPQNNQNKNPYNNYNNNNQEEGSQGYFANE